MSNADSVQYVKSDNLLAKFADENFDWFEGITAPQSSFWEVSRIGAFH
jgi:hypothetical protein